jgi:hypothetical protein
MYGWETTFGTASALINKALGHKVKISGHTRNNNAEVLPQLNSVEGTKTVVKGFRGKFTMDFVPGNFYWLRSIAGTTPTDAGAGPYTHTHVDSGAAKPPAKAWNSFTMELGDDVDTDIRTKLLGCVIKSFSAKISAGELAGITAEVEYANETIDATLTSSPPDDTYADPFIYAHSSFELPVGSSIADVTDLELQVERMGKLEDVLGSRFANQATSSWLKYTLKSTALYEAYANFLTKFMGGAAGPVLNPAEIASARILLDNGMATTSSRKMDFKFAGLQIDEHSASRSAEETTKENATLLARQWTLAQYTDNTAVSP